MTTADLLRDIDQRNRGEYARQRMGALVAAFLAPAATSRSATETAIACDGAVASEPLPPPGLLSVAGQAAATVVPGPRGGRYDRGVLGAGASRRASLQDQ